MLKSETVVIGADTYAVTQLPAMRAMKLFSRAGAIIGPALAKLGPAIAEGGLSGADLGVIGGAMEVLFGKLTDAELEYLTGELFWALTKNGQPMRVGKEFELEMAGSMMTVFHLLRFAFEVNFADFFGAARGALRSPPARPQPAP